MIIGVPKESHPGERRVAATPETVRKFQAQGHTVLVESGAGAAASFPDTQYIEIGAGVVGRDEVWSRADLVLKVRAPEFDTTRNGHEADLLRNGAALICFVWPAQNRELVEKLAAKNLTTLAMDCVPRISRAQKMDALSSMANIAGHRAVIEAAHCFGRFFTGQITAAGKVPPAKVLVIGAGVAGLAAIGTAAALGAVVRAFDTRPEVKEQIQSLGAEFLEVRVEEEASGEGGYARTMSPAYIAAEMELFAQQAMEVDIIITTALVPGKEAPKLITSGMVESMQEGSVIVDLAAAQGGNCALTEVDRVVHKMGVTIIGYTDLPSRLPTQSSRLYANNLAHMVAQVTRDAALLIDTDDEVVRGALVTYKGQVTWPAPKRTPPPAPPASAGRAPTPNGNTPIEYVEESKTAHVAAATVEPPTPLQRGLAIAVVVGFLLGVSTYAPTAFLEHLTVFVLACFVGWQLVWNVTPALHTPLMSVTNAISGIILLGALLQFHGPHFSAPNVLAAVALFLAMINVTGGFAVTHRMLRMFRKD
jgi:NAD(P) transhydrogenase subunit alpha